MTEGGRVLDMTEGRKAARMTTEGGRVLDRAGRQFRLWQKEHGDAASDVTF